MAHLRHVITYLVFLALCITAISLALNYGAKTFPTSPSTASNTVGERQTQSAPDGNSYTAAIAENLRSPLVILLAQIVLIVVVARALGYLLTIFGQPRVIGEMIAGI